MDSAKTLYICDETGMLKLKPNPNFAGFWPKLNDILAWKTEHPLEKTRLVITQRYYGEINTAITYTNTTLLVLYKSSTYNERLYLTSYHEDTTEDYAEEPRYVEVNHDTRGIWYKFPSVNFSHEKLPPGGYDIERTGMRFHNEEITIHCECAKPEDDLYNLEMYDEVYPEDQEEVYPEDQEEYVQDGTW